jgi:hypothetical protein
LESTITSIIDHADFNDDFIFELKNIIAKEHDLSIKQLKDLSPEGDLVASVGSMDRTSLPTHTSSEIKGKLDNYKERAIVSAFLSTTLSLEEDDK